MENTQTEMSGFTLEVEKRENVGKGILGALLGALAGGILYFIIYQVGFIAGITGFVGFILAKFLYEKFSGVKNSIKGIVFSVIFTVVMILAAEFFAIAYDFYSELSDFGIGFFEVLEATPEIILDPEVLPEVIKEVAIALGLSALAAAGSVAQAVKESKEAKNPKNQD